MASSKEFVQYICDQMSAATPVTYKSMFGEYGLFAEGKFFAIICDNQLFFKPTEAGRAAFSLPECSPYEGAKLYLLLENPEKAGLVSHVARVTLDALPLHPKKAKKKDTHDRTRNTA